MRGMFAFVIWDSRRKLLFFGAGPLGIKLFHYYADNQQFVCARGQIHPRRARSSCKANHAAIGDYLFSGFLLSDRSMFEGICSPAGACGREPRGRSLILTSSMHDNTFDEAVRVQPPIRSTMPFGCTVEGRGARPT